MHIKDFLNGYTNGNINPTDTALQRVFDMARPKATKAYSLFKKNNRPNFYVRFKNQETGEFNSNGLSTGTSDRAEAEMIAMQWLVNGIDNKPTVEAQSIIDSIKKSKLTKKDADSICAELKKQGLISTYIVKDSRKAVIAADYFLDFYSLDSKTRKLNDMKIAASTSIAQTYTVKNYWIPFLGKKYLAEFTTDDLRDFKMQLQEKENISDITKKGILKTGLTVFRQAYNDNLIDSDITLGIKNISAKGKKKDILTIQQAETLFMSEWKNPKIKLANLLAARTGMRIGEVIGLQKEDLMQIDGVNFIWVRHSYAKNKDGLHGTKTGSESKIPITDNGLFAALLHLANTNPYNNGFVFWADRSDNGKPKGISTHPITRFELLKALKEQLAACGFADSSKNITFHSWRHFHRTYMQAKGKLNVTALSHVTGHSEQMIENLYGDHVTEADVASYIEADKKTFQNTFADYFHLENQIEAAGSQENALAVNQKLIDCRIGA